METRFAVLLSYFSALVQAQAKKLLAAQVQIFRIKTITPSEEPGMGTCPGCAYLRHRVGLLEQIVAFFLRVKKQRGYRYTAGEYAWITSFVALHSIPRRHLRSTFGISPATFYYWKTKLADGWPASAFIKFTKPFADAMTFWLYAIKAANPGLGKRKISAFLKRLGFDMSPSSVWRYLRRVRPMPKRPSRKRPDPNSHNLQSEYPNHFWNADVTSLSFFGFFKIRILAVMDLYSRKILCLKAFASINKAHVRLALLDTFRRFGTPEHFITDHGEVFMDLRLNIDHRFGRVACPASTARIERFFKSLKWEALRYLFCPAVRSGQRYLDEYEEYYNRHRPHQSLAGATPDETYYGKPQKIPKVSDLRPLSLVEGLTEHDVRRVTFLDGHITVFRRRAA